MLKQIRIDPHRLPVQLVVSFIALVLLTAGAVGLPAIWLIHRTADRQAWAQVEQASNTTRALYAARLSDLTNLALITAQRPTIRELLVQKAAVPLQTYLQTLQSGAGLDVLVVCDNEHQLMAQAGTIAGEQLCDEPIDAGFYLEQSPDGSTSGAQVWLISTQSILSGSDGKLGQIIIGQLLDQENIKLIGDQTGVEQTLVLNDRVLTTSFDDKDQLGNALFTASPIATDGSRIRFSESGQPFYSIRYSLSSSGIENIVALPVADLALSQNQLTNSMLWSILIITLFGSILGILLAQRISQPLGNLRDAARGLRKGDLSSPVQVKTTLPEVATVAYALEDARAALQHTMLELQRERDWTEHLLASIVEGIVTLDQHGRITSFSHGAESISGWKEEQVIGRHCDDVFRTVDADERFSQRMPAPGRRQKVVVSMRNGHQVTLAVTGAALAPPEAGKARFVLVLRDVSDEEAIRRLLGDFLANISHEFRTPLSALAASIELLLDQLPELSFDEIQELLDSLHLGTLSLQTLIDNLLEGASIETGRFRVYPHPTDLAKVVQEAVRVMQPLLAKYEQHLVVELPDDLPLVKVDARRTGQVLVNLLSNAIKFGSRGGNIELSVSINDEIRVTVADRGPGLVLEDRPDVFSRFVHLGSDNDRGQHGAGLGLSVVRAIVEAQGGQVGAGNRTGGGAIFWFTILPASEEFAKEEYLA